MGGGADADGMHPASEAHEQEGGKGNQ